MEEGPAINLERLGKGRQVSRAKSAISLSEIWVDLKTSTKFWLILVVAVIPACGTFFCFYRAVTLETSDNPCFPIPDSALNEQLLALQQKSPWHDNAVGANQVCNSSECVHAAYHLLFGINHAANPCHDFYDFTCGNRMKFYKSQWLATNSRHQEMVISEIAWLKEILVRPPESYFGKIMKTASIFFRQCVNENNTNCLARTIKFFHIPMLHEYLMTKTDNNDYEALYIVDQMTRNIIATFHKILENNKWFSNATKSNAQKKLSALKTFIGYPDWLWNSVKIESRFEGIHAGSNFNETYGNVLKAMTNNSIRELGKSPSGIDEPWFTPQYPSANDDDDLILSSTVQAFYSHNSIVVSMGMIQPPLVYLNIPSYVNYGRIGAVIGHEISHGFDASKKNLNEYGDYTSCTTTRQDDQNYEEKSNCYRDQYDKFEISPGINLSGSRCLEENFADKPLLWCEHGIEAEQNDREVVHPHSPGKYRTNGVLQNSPEFADAWNCPVGSPMNPIKKCMLW